MKKIFLFIATLLTFYTKAQIQSSEQTKIDALFHRYTNTTPGANLGIIKDGKIIYSRSIGMADLEHNIPIMDSSVFYIGSVSKQFTAMCILLLEEQGKLNLDDRVQKYLPDFPEYDAPLTIRNFLNHTSGIRDNLTLWGLAGKDYLDHIDKEEMYHLIRRQKQLNYTPGERFMYSNSCYFMLGLIIEKISGESLKVFAKKNIFDPLDMHHTFFQDDNRCIIKNRACSYLEEKGEFKNQIMRYDLVGSGGIYSTIHDLYLWDQNFYHNKLGKRSASLIERLHKEDLLNNGKTSGTGYAYGVQNGVYRGLRTVRHGGALAGYRAYFYRFPEEHMSILILGNVTSVNIDYLPFELANILLEKKLSPLPAQAPNKREEHHPEQPKEFVTENLNQYTGAFYSEELNATYQFTVKERSLYCSINHGEAFKLTSVATDTFSVDGYFNLKFEKNAQQKVVGYSLSNENISNIRFQLK